LTTIISDFRSKECKSNNHNDCNGQWIGLGFQIICDCKCGHNKKGTVLAEVGGLVANAMSMVKPTQEETLR
jgi:hypothetical protein